MRARKDGAPNRMSVQDRAGVYAARDGEMEQSFRRRSAIAAYDVGRFVHFQKLCGRKAALVQARRSNRQPQRLVGNHGTEVSTGAQNPSARMKTLSNLHQASGCFRKGHTIATGLRNSSGALLAFAVALGFLHHQAVTNSASAVPSAHLSILRRFCDDEKWRNLRRG